MNSWHFTHITTFITLTNTESNVVVNCCYKLCAVTEEHLVWSSSVVHILVQEITMTRLKLTN